MRLQRFAATLAVLFCHTVVTANGFYISANNQTTTPISVEASHNATPATTLTSSVVKTTKLPTTSSTLLVATTIQKPTINETKATSMHTSGSVTTAEEQVNAMSSTLLVATTTQKPTINATKSTAMHTSGSMNTPIKEQVTFGSIGAATTTMTSTTVAITSSSSDKKGVWLPWVRGQEDSKGHPEGHDKSVFSTLYGKVALSSGVAFLLVVLAAVVFLSVTIYHERKREERVLMGDIESIDAQDDDTD